MVLALDPAIGLLVPGGPQTRNPRYFAVPRGLVGYWSLDPDTLDLTNNLALDLSGNAYTGTLSGTTKPTLAAGQVGTALSFDGATGFVDLGTCPLVAGLVNNLTVTAWVNPASVTGFRSVLATKTNNKGWRFGLAASEIDFVTYGIKDYNSTGASLATNTWRLIGASMDAANGVTFWADGKRLNLVTGVSPANSASLGYRLGIGQSGTELFSGPMDEVRVYNRILDAGEHQQLYQAGLMGRRDAMALLPAECEMAALKAAPAPAAVITARPVGIPHAYEPRHYQVIRGKGRVALPGLGALSSGIVVRPKARQTAPAITGRAAVTLPGLSASAMGAVLVAGSGAATLAPPTAAGAGRHDIFHADQLAVINSMLALL